MIALMLGTFILALTYGAFWHGEPARRQSQQREHDDSRVGRLLSRALEWLLLMPHPSYPVARKALGKTVIPRQTGFLRQVCALPGGRNGLEYAKSKKSHAGSPAAVTDSLWQRIASPLVLLWARLGMKAG